MQWFFNNFVRRTHEKVLEATLTPNRRFWFGSIAIATILFSASVLQDKPPSTKVASGKPGKASSSSSSSSTSSSSDSSEDPYSMNGHMCSWQWFTVVTCYNETIIWFTSSAQDESGRQLAFQVRAPTALWLKFPNDVVNNSHILDTVCTFCIGQLTKFVCFRPEILIHSHRKRQGMTNIRTNIVSTCFQISRSTTLQRMIMHRHQQLLEPQDSQPKNNVGFSQPCLRMFQHYLELQVLRGRINWLCRQSQVQRHHPAVAVMRRNILWCCCICLEILGSNPPT